LLFSVARQVVASETAMLCEVLYYIRQVNGVNGGYTVMLWFRPSICHHWVHSVFRCKYLKNGL